MDELVIHQLDGDQAFATLGPVVIRVINGARTDTAAIDTARRLADEVLQRSSLVGIWIIVHHGSPVPDGEVRRYTARVLGSDSDKQAIVYSMLGLGFWASAAISFVVMVSKLLGQPALVETTVEDGAQRMAMEMIGVDPAKLVAAHDELLRRLHIDAVA